MTSGWLAPREFRRQLRRQSTDAERRLWAIVRDQQLGAKFRRQHSLGGFTLDFYSPSARLVIELDGGQHFEEAHRARDARRDAALAARGIEVLRFTDVQVLLETNAVRQAIWSAVERRVLGESRPSPQPSPFQGGGAQ